MKTENSKTNEPHKFALNLSQRLDEFALPDGSYSVSDIQGYIEYIIKNMKHYPLILLLIFTTIGLITD